MTELDLYLLRYGEIGTKSPNIRKHFEDILIQNLERTFLAEGEEIVTEKRGRGRIFAYLKEENSHLLSRIFGLVSYSRAKRISADLTEMISEAEDFASDISGSFAVRARRVGEHDYNSQKVEDELGDAMLESNPDLEVDLEDPEHELHMEIRHSQVYVFTTIEEGPGGLPLSSQGKVAAYVETKKDFIATWMMMKRGARPYVYHPPSEWADRLKSWDPNPKRMEVSDREEMLSLDLPNEVRAVVLGETLEDLTEIETQHMVLRPLIGFTDERIDSQLEKITRLEKGR
ncbi:MAG: hypothetical protein KGY76_09075 [Candidatus Thermoplasmatota archaeon]|nr:hypothetical protein [Candidatus Thermoplasmatota archaeon]